MQLLGHYCSGRNQMVGSKVTAHRAIATMALDTFVALLLVLSKSGLSPRLTKQPVGVSAHVMAWRTLWKFSELLISLGTFMSLQSVW